MMPTLLQIGPLSISSFGTALAVGLVLFSFLVWHSARDRGVADEKILDNIIVVVCLGLIGSRLAYVATHWQLFAPNLLRIFVVWKFPGLSLWGALLFGLAGFFLFTRRQKLDRAIMFDSYGTAMPVAVVLISLGVFLDGSVVGRETMSGFGLPAVGVTGSRHPVAIYGAVLGLLLFIIIILLRNFAKKKGIPRSFIGWSAILGLGLILFVLALYRVDLLYLGPVPVDFGLCVILIVWSIAPLFVLLKAPALFKLITSKYRHIKTKN